MFFFFSSWWLAVLSWCCSKAAWKLQCSIQTIFFLVTEQSSNNTCVWCKAVPWNKQYSLQSSLGFVKDLCQELLQENLQSISIGTFLFSARFSANNRNKSLNLSFSAWECYKLQVWLKRRKGSCNCKLVLLRKGCFHFKHNSHCTNSRVILWIALVRKINFYFNFMAHY